MWYKLSTTVEELEKLREQELTKILNKIYEIYGTVPAPEFEYEPINSLEPQSHYMNTNGEYTGQFKTHQDAIFEALKGLSMKGNYFPEDFDDHLGTMRVYRSPKEINVSVSTFPSEPQFEAMKRLEEAAVMTNRKFIYCISIAGYESKVGRTLQELKRDLNELKKHTPWQ